MFEKTRMKRLNSAVELYQAGKYEKAYSLMADNYKQVPIAAREAAMARYYMAEMNYKKLIDDATYSRAKYWYIKAIDILCEHYPEEKELINEIEVKLGIIAYENAEYDLATSYLEGKTEPEALEILEEIAESEREDEEDRKQADESILKCEDPKQLLQQGEDYEENGDSERALMCYERAAALNDGEGMICVAIFYVKTNFDKTLEYLKKAAQSSEKELALKLMRGYGSHPEKYAPRELTFEERFNSLKAAIEFGDEYALINLGNLILGYKKIAKEETTASGNLYLLLTALECYKKAANSSNPEIKEMGTQMAEEVKSILPPLDNIK